MSDGLAQRLREEIAWSQDKYDSLLREYHTLKAQLKREMAVTNMAAMDLPNQALELARETVKARGELRKDE